MIERTFIKSRLKEFQVQEYLTANLKRVGHSHTKIQRSPLGDKVIIHASRPGLIIGRQGSNIKLLTKTLKNKFKLENPQIEINEVEKPNTDAQIVAEGIANNLEAYGSQRFKGIGHKVMTEVLRSGDAVGCEILISGKIPSSRAKRWRFYAGFLKKCGDIAVSQVKTAKASARLKTGVVGIIVKIMPANIRLPYDIRLIEEAIESAVVEEVDTDATSKLEAEAIGVEDSSVQKSKTSSTAEVKSEVVAEPAKEEAKAEETTKEKPKKAPAKIAKAAPKPKASSEAAAKAPAKKVEAEAPVVEAKVEEKSEVKKDEN